MAPTKKAATTTTEADAPAAKVTKKNASSKSNDDDSAAKKHNGPPKGALNAYSCFIRENREAIHADENYKNFMKSAAAAWKAVEDKSEYEQMAKEDKERYEREIASYTPGK